MTIKLPAKNIRKLSKLTTTIVRKFAKLKSDDNLVPIMVFVMCLLISISLLYLRSTSVNRSKIVSDTNKNLVIASNVIDNYGPLVIQSGTQLNADEEGKVLGTNTIPGNICTSSNSTRILKIGDSISATGVYMPDAINLAMNSASTLWYTEPLNPLNPPQAADLHRRYSEELDRGAFAAMIMLGTNDCGGIPISNFISNLEQIVDEVASHNIIPILSTIPPRTPDCISPGRDAYNNAIIQLASRKNVPIRNISLSNAQIYDGYHPNDSGFAELNNQSCDMINSIESQCNKTLDYDCGETAEIPTQIPITSGTNSNTSTGGVVQSSNTTGSGICNKLGVNAAVQFSRPKDVAGRNGTGWFLSIAEFPNEIDPSAICSSGVKTIIRPWCDGTTCANFFSNVGELAAKLNEIQCEVFVTGPNEPESEMFGSVDATIQAMVNLTNAVTNPNVKILTPVFNGTHPNRSSFIPAVSAGLPWGRIHGIAVNVYTLPGGDTASSYLDSSLSLIGRDLPVYVTEIGPIEEKSGVDRDTAINNLKGEINNIANRGNVEAVLFFNGSGDNPSDDFEYGCIESDELDLITDGMCPDDGQSYCGTRAGGPVLSGEAGCCEFMESDSIKSCEAKSIYDNGNNSDGLDSINAGAQMYKVVNPDPADIPPNYDYNFPAGEERWVYKYAITQHIHNVPLLQFLAGIEGTEKHPFTTGPERDTNVNRQNNLYSYVNQFPGIATFQLSNGSYFQLQVPSLGTASASGQFDINNRFEAYRPHCGLTYRTEDVDLNNQENNDFLSLIKRLFTNREDESVTKFDISTKSNYLDKLKEYISRIKQYLSGGTSDECLGLCGSTVGAPLRACDNSDAYKFDIKFYEIIVQANIWRGTKLPAMKPLTPAEVCEEMFVTGMVAGGTCNMTNGSLQQITGDYNPIDYPGEYALGASRGLASNGKVSPKELYETLKEEGGTGTSIGGEPFYRIEFWETVELQLEGLLEYLQETYRTEAIYTPPNYKICHNDNVGIKVPSTKRVYDYFLTGTGGANDAPAIDEGLVNAEDPPEQIFYAVDVGGDAKPFEAYGMCDPRNYVMLPGEKQKFSLKVAANDGSGAGSSVATVEHYFPWVGQIPIMMERTATWALHQQFDFTDPSIGQKIEGLTGDDLELALQIIEKQFVDMKSVNIDFKDVYIFPCDFFNKENGKKVIPILKSVFNYNDTDIERIINGDCLCGTDDSDPLQNYLFSEGKLAEELEYYSMIAADANGDGIPDQCSYANPPSEDGVINPVSGEPVDIDDFQSPVNTINITQCYGPTVGNQYPSSICPTFGGNYGPIQGQFHSGVDLGTAQPIYAAAGGRVIWAGFATESQFDPRLQNLKEYGNHVLVEHPGGLRTRYSHLASINVKVGDDVSAGDLLGQMGNTGNSKGVHLHFEIIRGACAEWANSSTGPSGRDCYVDPTSIFVGGDGVQTPTIISDQVNNADLDDIICSESEGSDDDLSEIDPEYSNPTGSAQDHICLAKKVASFLNGYNSKGRIPWHVILGVWESETKRRCAPLYSTFFTTLDENKIYPAIGEFTLRDGKSFPMYDFRDTCGGDPNQLALTDVQTQDLDGKGIGGHLKGTFLAIIKNWYWYKPNSNADDTGELLSACMDHLGVNRSIGKEDSSEEGGAFWDWTNSSGYSVPNDEKDTLDDQFSRKRVGDTLCAMAIQLAENAANNQDGYITPENWTFNDVTNAAYGYYGACAFAGGNYCENVIARSELFKELYENVSCGDGTTGPTPDDGDETTACPYLPEQPYYIRQETDGPSHSLCEYRKYYKSEFSGYYQAVDLNIERTGANVIVRAPVTGKLKVVHPSQNTYNQCNGNGTPYDGGWAFEITSGGKIYRMLHVRPVNIPAGVNGNIDVTAGQELGVLYTGTVGTGGDAIYNATGRGCFSSTRPHIHMTIVGDGDPAGFIRNNCHGASYNDRDQWVASWQTDPGTCCTSAGVCGCSIDAYDPANPQCIRN